MSDEAPKTTPRRRYRFWLWSAAAVVVLPLAVWTAAAWLAHRNSPKWIFDGAEDAFRRNDLDAVWTAAEALADVEGYQPHVHLLKGMTDLRTGRLEEAIEAFGVAQADPEIRTQAYVLTGEALYKARRFREADKILTAAVQLDPSRTDAHRWLAALYYDIGAMDHVLAELQVIAEQAPDDPRPYRLRGLIYKDFPANYGQDPIAEYYESLRRDPNQPDGREIRLELAECLVKQGRFDEAIDVLAPCAKSPDLLAIEAECQAGKGDKTAARRLLAEALSLDSSHLACLLLQASLDLQAGDGAAAERTLRQAAVRHPKNIAVHYRLAQVYQSLGQKRQSEEELRLRDELHKLHAKFSELHGKAVASPADAEVRYELGALAGQLDRPALARSWFQAALALDPNHPQARRALRSAGPQSGEVRLFPPLLPGGNSKALGIWEPGSGK